MNRDPRLTLADLVAKKLQKQEKKRKTKDYFVPSLEGNVLIEQPEEAIVLKSMDMMGDGNLTSIVAAYDYLIYNSIAVFRDPELHKEYEIIDPIDIVSALLELNERFQIGEAITKMSGIEDLGNDVKN
ncbi:hypothetical protein [Paenibacillus aquistagni]|uniref:Phage XkdN-like tail assembly chaperone protein, TAC n=1 Tax=Paenibacillus aquistagni TaxID=1852522 RepID=A0A1X7LWD2_9BACL|nr:hypothetical protein [Paenibacillus aquistagni]SMG58198.1 hypothetical protein SAMN06295960_4643 [Paenibacillus aquistagni]